MDADRWMRKRERWERKWERRRAYRNSPGKHLFGGIVFVLIGVVFLLGNMGVVDADRVIRFWPVLLIALGAFKIVEAGDDYAQSSGIFWVVLGGFLLLGSLGILRVVLAEMWPVLLIAIGVLMLWRSTLAKGQRWQFGPGATTTNAPKTGFVSGSESGSASAAGAGPGPGSESGAGSESRFDSSFESSGTSSNSHFSATAILGGFERRINSQDFRGGDAMAVMGGCKIDLRGASITVPHEPVIKVFALFGGIEIRVPDDWTVISEVEMILGGFNDKKAEPPRIESKRLIIRGQVMMGGIEVRN